MFSILKKAAKAAKAVGTIGKATVRTTTERIGITNTTAD